MSYTHPESGETISIPYAQQEIIWPSLYGLFSPVCMEISEGLRILHCTSDILGIVEHNGKLEITLFGDRDLAGEIVFEGMNIGKIKSAMINGDPLQVACDEKRVVVNYSHMHKKEFVVSIKSK